MDAIINFFLNFQGPTAYLVIFGVLLACGLGIPIPEDITLIGAGVLAYYGKADVWAMVAVGMAGVMIGDTTIFLFGRKYGTKLTRHRVFSKLLSAQRVEQASEMFNKRGLKLLFAARFMPGFRAPIFFTAGTLGIPMKKLFLYDGSAALLSVPAIVYFTYHFGDQLDHVIANIRKIENGILFVIFCAIGFFVVKWWWKTKRRKASSVQ